MSTPKKSSPSPSALTTQQAAYFLGVHPNTLYKWRVSGTGPAFIGQGRSVRYRLVDLELWQQQNRFSSTTERDVRRSAAA